MFVSEFKSNRKCGLCQKTCDNINIPDGNVYDVLRLFDFLPYLDRGERCCLGVDRKSALKVCLWYADTAKTKTCFSKGLMKGSAFFFHFFSQKELRIENLFKGLHFQSSMNHLSCVFLPSQSKYTIIQRVLFNF